MAIIGLGELSIKLTFPLLMAISKNIQSAVLNLLSVSERFKQFPFLMGIFISLSLILGGLLEFIVCLKNKSLKQDQLLEKKDSQHLSMVKPFQFARVGLNKKTFNQLTLKNVLIILLVTILSLMENHLLMIIFQYININATNLRYQLKIVNLFFIAGISIPILNSPLFRHHYCSMGIILIGLFFLLFESLKTYPIVWYFAILLTLNSSLLSIQKVCQKYLMHFKYFSPYRILLYEGSIGLIISIILEIILSFIPCPKNWFCTGFDYLEDPSDLLKSFDLYIFIYLLCIVIFSGIYSLLSILTNKFFTPTHIVISDIFSAFIFWALNFFYVKDQFSIEFILICLIGFIITLFGAFMYTEIIIVYCFGLSYYTKLEIENRGRESYTEIANMQLRLSCIEVEEYRNI